MTVKGMALAAGCGGAAFSNLLAFLAFLAVRLGVPEAP
jgi:hypothetical protein